MSSETTVSWQGLEGIEAALDQYKDMIREAARRILEFFQPIIETFAKENASWTDRTGNARQALNADVVELSQDAVMLYLAHGMDYGLWLEVKWAGRFAILWRTIQTHLEAVTLFIQQVFG